MSKSGNILQIITKGWRFLTEDVWRVSESDISIKRRKGYNFLKVVSLAVRLFQSDQLSNKASALTYGTLLSLVPMLAVILSIAKGFGFNNIIQSQLFDYFPGPKEILITVFNFIDSYLQHAKSGIFIGLGIILLLFTVLNLISNIEDTFNAIWQLKKGRSIYRKVTDYFSMFLILPVFILCSSGVSIFMSTTFETLNHYQVLTPLIQVVMKLSPWVITILLFTLLYIFMPNTHVQFKHAFYAGIFAGIGFQIFQYLYINGQIWVSKYNAIYGSFALLPLLLLWIQLSWTICLIGAEIAYASQNVRSYEYETDSKNISRRYRDFLILLIATLIIKRFEKGEKAYTPDEVSIEYRIPIRLTHSIIFDLCEINILSEIKDENDEVSYQPGIDINKITIAYLFSKIDTEGSENFNVDNEIEFKSEWDAIIKSREEMYRTKNQSILLKDL